MQLIIIYLLICTRAKLMGNGQRQILMCMPTHTVTDDRTALHMWYIVLAKRDHTKSR